MHIYSVNDPEFKSYGNVWDNVPSELTSPVLEALSATPIPEGSKYVASAPELEGVKDADKLGFLMFGGRPFQLGWCNGHNTQLNCLEYHRASEFNLGARDFILLVAHRWEIEDGKLDTACVKAFRVPAGTVVEVFNTTLHYTPCMVDEGGFQVMVALPAPDLRSWLYIQPLSKILALYEAPETVVQPDNAKPVLKSVPNKKTGDDQGN